jgi:hypothetical protein
MKVHDRIIGSRPTKKVAEVDVLDAGLLSPSTLDCQRKQRPQDGHGSGTHDDGGADTRPNTYADPNEDRHHQAEQQARAPGVGFGPLPARRE